mgnify:CR=1 FL=1
MPPTKTTQTLAYPVPQTAARAITLAADWDGAEAARHAIAAARDGARVLVIRNTVKAALEGFKAIGEAGGGVARDVGYLRGWLEVRRAIRQGELSIDHLRAGRVGFDVARALPELVEAGLARPPRYCPSLVDSLFSTDGGTSRDTSPPSLAASFTMLEET